MPSDPDANLEFAADQPSDGRQAAPACRLCPRGCGRPRTPEQPGWCGAAEARGLFRVARLMVHHWEEPFISGSRGSGAVFFSGCNLGCCFCQNSPISRQFIGTCIEGGQLIEEVRLLHAAGVHNLNLVTPSHYADRLPDWLADLKGRPWWRERPLPVVWNSSAYETAASLRPLAGLADIYLPDLKYQDPALSGALAGAPDYFDAAARALLEMLRQQPRQVWDENALLVRGLAVRHLVLPGHWRDSCRILDFLAAHLPADTPIALMSQYTPQPHTDRRRPGGSGNPGNPDGPDGQGSQDNPGGPDGQGRADDPADLTWPAGHPELDRRLTTLEYRKVLDYALDAGFTRIIGQDRSAADRAYTPDFSGFLRPGRI